MPMSPPESIHSTIGHTVLSGTAKRAPSMLCVAICELLSVPCTTTLLVVATLEMLHVASLVHDDLLHEVIMEVKAGELPSGGDGHREEDGAVALVAEVLLACSGDVVGGGWRIGKRSQAPSGWDERSTIFGSEGVFPIFS
ncbi:geranylgeranyl pyrophosphate synthase 11, chloroplastic-like [Phragmites australis]|uniref:geranylgeranyl pyrophosphate synthase 11, chloroplastic-like n=1 Tax=Phragmites australis TaxID=29695 RepID=UPI002D794394|nr:geranylgeranyl pyrophosphate synthase 11, chloroplastic-like [Phragmites australis]